MSMTFTSGEITIFRMWPGVFEVCAERALPSSPACTWANALWTGVVIVAGATFGALVDVLAMGGWCDLQESSR